MKFKGYPAITVVIEGLSLDDDDILNTALLAVSELSFVEMTLINSCYKHDTCIVSIPIKDDLIYDYFNLQLQVKNHLIEVLRKLKKDKENDL